jgi:OOP family OmpA-OmpF porin
MIRRIVIIAAVVVGLVLLSNAFGRGDDPVDEPVTDSEASETIAAVRDAETNAGVGGVQIEVSGDTVTLYGTVATTAELAVAEAVARSVVGVDMKIDNQLTAEDAVDGATAGPPSATGDDIALQNRLSSVLARNPIIFESASSTIAADSAPALEVLAVELSNVPAVAVLIAGHTDSDGEEAANLTLSQARAEAVLAYLVGVGIDANRLSAQGFGETFPISDNVSQEGKALNRRIEVLVQP